MKRFETIERNFLAALALWLLCVVTPASAGILTIVGDVKIEVSLKGEQVKVNGFIEAINQGDETAVDVYPGFSLGQWSWAGEPKILEAGSQVKWDLDQSFERAELECGEDDLCSGMQLPARGNFPILIHRYYSDQNNYRFSSPFVTHAQIGNFTDDEQSAMRIPPIESNFLIDGDGQNFKGVLKIDNLTSEPIKVALGYHTARELRVAKASKILEVEPKGRAQAEVEIENLRGLAGSTYTVFSILQWEQSGLRNMQVVFGSVGIRELAPIAKKQESHKFYGIGIVVVLVSLLLVGIVLFARRK